MFGEDPLGVDSVRRAFAKTTMSVDAAFAFAQTNAPAIRVARARLRAASHSVDFAIADLTLNPGETKTISIELNNPEMSYIAFEFYITLPEGISIPEDEGGNLMAELNASRINSHNLEVSLMPDGKYHFLCYSGQNNALQGTSGEIISLTVKAADNAPEASGLEGLLSTQKLSDPNKK